MGWRPPKGEGEEGEEEEEADQSIWRASSLVRDETCSRMKYSHDRGRWWKVEKKKKKKKKKEKKKRRRRRRRRRRA